MKRRRKFSRSIHASSQKHDWRTPAWLVRLVRDALGGRIDLDPCAGRLTRIGRRNVRAPSDGIGVPWIGTVYVNPPYGRAIRAWVRKACDSDAQARIVVLIPARTDTRAFHEAAAAASSTCLLRGRLQFIGATASAPFPSVLFHFGPHAEQFDRVFRQHGLIARFDTPPRGRSDQRVIASG